MQVLTQISSPYCCRRQVLPFSRTRFNVAGKKTWSLGDTRGKDKVGLVLAIERNLEFRSIERQRKVVEHICLVKGKEDLSEEQEQEMMDYLYTTQYQMRGIVAISLGRISDQNPEQYTHAIFIRFQTREDLAMFYENPCYIGILKEHVIPNCHDFMNLDFESEVEDDILAIFRKGEEFNYGLELILLVAFTRSSLGAPAEDAMTSLANLTLEFPSLILQATKGPNFNISSMEYTHGVVIRFRSSEAFKIFMNSLEYNTLWKFKFQPVVQKALSVYFRVDPIGMELM